ncbi:hypothetical protein CPB85DRAFT_1430329 [Mucidula mucida]|nr:hypothetical protein CPB85DRAFT_1430329 [Mucidula mucida]
MAQGGVRQDLLRHYDIAAYRFHDVVVVWRTWCIWYDNALVRAYLAILLVATAATSIATAILTGKVDFTVTNMLGTFCLLVTNFSTTILCGYKVWQYMRSIKVAYGGRTNRTTFVENVLFILVESGAIYCLFWAITAYSAMFALNSSISCLTSLDLIFVSLSRLSPETFYSVVDYDLQQQFSTSDALAQLGPKSNLMAGVSEDNEATANASSGHTLTLELDSDRRRNYDV